MTHKIIDEYLESIDLDYPLFKGDRGGGRIAPPDLAPKFAARNLYTNYIRDHFGNPIRAKQALAFDRVVLLGSAGISDAQNWRLL